MARYQVLEKNNSNNRSGEPDALKKNMDSEISLTNPVMENLLSEGGDDFFQYLKWIGLAKESNLMVLSSMHHYYYDHNDLKGIKTLINLKRLNEVRHLESFLHTLSRILPYKAYFIGCFTDHSHKGQSPRTQNRVNFLAGLISIFDSRNERSLTSKSTSNLLEEFFFKVIDTTYINGMAYFWAQNNKKQ